MFNKEHLQYWIQTIEYLIPALKGSIDDFLQKQKAQFHRNHGEVIVTEVLHFNGQFIKCQTEKFSCYVVGFCLDFYAALLFNFDRGFFSPRISVGKRRRRDQKIERSQLLRLFLTCSIFQSLLEQKQGSRKCFH